MRVLLEFYAKSSSELGITPKLGSRRGEEKSLCDSRNVEAVILKMEAKKNRNGHKSDGKLTYKCRFVDEK